MPLRARWAFLIAAATVMLGASAGVRVPIQSLTEFSIPGADHKPGDMVAGPNDLLWFTDREANAIGRVTAKNGKILEFAVPSASAGLDEIAIGKDGNAWFTEAGVDKIGRITPSGVITEFSVPVEDSDMNGIVAGQDGAIWFTRAEADKVYRMTTSGVVRSFTVKNPWSIAAARNGSIWFTRYGMFGGGGIGRISSAGTIDYPVRGDFEEADHLLFAPDGALWFGEDVKGVLHRATPSGEIKTFSIPGAGGMNHFAGLAAAGDGSIWITEDANVVAQLKDGKVVRTFPLKKGSFPSAITVAPDGNIWFTEYGSGKIGWIAATSV